MAHKTKESKGEKKHPAISLPSCPTRGAAFFPTKPRIPSTNPGLDNKVNSPELLLSRLKFLLLLYLFFFLDY
jgi:hypothetical protein